MTSSTNTNRLALISFFCAFLTLISFCMGLVPIPLSAWVCYPSAMLTGLAALMSGFAALRQIRVSGERGRGMALLSIWMGALSMLAVLCFTSITILIFYYGAGFIHNLGFQLKP